MFQLLKRFGHFEGFVVFFKVGALEYGVAEQIAAVQQDQRAGVERQAAGGVSHMCVVAALVSHQGAVHELRLDAYGRQRPVGAWAERVKPRDVHTDQIVLVMVVEQLDHIDTIRENKDLAEKLVTIRHGVEVISIVIVAVLLAISVFIISNTIKLTVYSRRLEISIMKSVGATNSFVRLPFVVEGMILGIISGVISLGLVWAFYEFAIHQFSDLLSSLQLDALNFADYALPMLGIFIAIGIVTGVGGALISMGRYLNREGSEISAI